MKLSSQFDRFFSYFRRSREKQPPSFFKPLNRKSVGDKIITGIIILAPAYITFIIIRFVVDFLGGPLRPLTAPLFRWLPRPLENLLSSLIAVLITIFLIFLIGVIGQKVIGRRIVIWVEGFLSNFPLIGTIYNTIKEVFAIFSQKEKYQSVVFIRAFGHRCLGFMTNQLLRPDGTKEYRIFVPTVPNPTTGYLFFVQGHEVEFTDISVEVALKVLFSGGVLDYHQAEAIKSQPFPPRD